MFTNACSSFVIYFSLMSSDIETIEKMRDGKVNIKPATNKSSKTAAIELQKQQKRYALVTMSVGVGQGYAVILERS